MKKAIGIDLGGTSVKMGFIQEDGKILDKWSIPTDSRDKGQYIISNIIQSIQDKLEDSGDSIQDFSGIGMGSPGNVDRVLGTVIGAYNLDWTEKQFIKEQITEKFDLPFILDNDANVAALGEQWVGAGENESNIVFITLGTGVGGGIIVDNHLLHGATGSAGEIGHMTVATKKFNFECTCGKTGCLETVASATGVVKIAEAMSREFSGKSKLKDIANSSELIEAKDIFDLAKKDDSLALEVVNQVGDYLAFACGNLANILNPSTFVLGGGVSKAGDILIQTIENKLDKYIFPPMKDSIKIRIAELENDAGILGSSSLILK